MSIEKITRQTGRSRKLVRSVLRGGDGDVFRCRSSILEPYLVMLGVESERGRRNGAELWRRLRAAGSLEAFGSWQSGQPGPAPSTRKTVESVADDAA